MNSSGIPYLTHWWIAAAEIEAPSVETITRSTSKKGRSKITSPFLFTTNRSLFFETETPKPSTNTSPTILSTGLNFLLVREIVAEAPDTPCPVQGLRQILFVLIQGFFQEGEESSFEFGTTEDLCLGAEGGDLTHRPEDARGGAGDYGAPVFEALYRGLVVGDDGLAVGYKSVLTQANLGRLER